MSGKLQAKRAQEVDAAEKRRRAIAWKLGAHFTQAEIAAQLGVSQGTVSKDVKRIREEWRQRYAETYDELRTEEMAKLDNLEHKVLAEVDEHTLVSPWLVKIQLDIMDRRARLMGLDKPIKVQAEVTHRYRDELDAKILQLVRNERGDDNVIDVAPVDDARIIRALGEGTNGNGSNGQANGHDGDGKAE